jgi:hypothetical protein
MSTFNAGDKVEIKERGEWIGPYTVTDMKGRTPDHLVLEGKHGYFEQYNDAPYNVRLAEPEDEQERNDRRVSEHEEWLGTEGADHLFGE